MLLSPLMGFGMDGPCNTVVLPIPLLDLNSHIPSIPSNPVTHAAVAFLCFVLRLTSHTKCPAVHLLPCSSAAILLAGHLRRWPEYPRPALWRSVPSGGTQAPPPLLRRRHTQGSPWAVRLCSPPGGADTVGVRHAAAIRPGVCLRPLLSPSAQCGRQNNPIHHFGGPHSAVDIDGVEIRGLFAWAPACVPNDPLEEGGKANRYLWMWSEMI